MLLDSPPGNGEAVGNSSGLGSGNPSWDYLSSPLSLRRTI